MFSDLLRLSILRDYGGLWVDATCFCNKSLDEWLPEPCFLFENFNMSFTVSIWFIYSEPNHSLITTWYTNLRNQINDVNDVNPLTNYFICNQTFDKLCTENLAFKTEWEKIPKIDQNDHLIYFDLEKKGNLHIESNGFLQPLTQELKALILEKRKYVFKLSYKYDSNKVMLDQSILAFLFDSIKKV